MRDDSERLLDILSAIHRVLAKTGTGSEAFQSDEMLAGVGHTSIADYWRVRHPDEI